MMERAYGVHQVEKFQTELDKLNGTLKQIEAYNEQMKGEIAVTRRATYVAEEAVTRLEKDKKDQDYLIDTLQEQLKRLHQQHQLYEVRTDISLSPLHQCRWRSTPRDFASTVRWLSAWNGSRIRQH
jgi:septal ring factor EnvC (AmiA/AmiB activator)